MADNFLVLGTLKRRPIFDQRVKQELRLASLQALQMWYQDHSMSRL